MREDWEQDEFDWDAPYQAHSETSRAAAEAIAPDASTLRGQVYGYIQRCGARGATDDEIQVALDMNPSTERPRRIELREAGLVGDSGCTRPTRSGRKAVVWIEIQREGLAGTPTV